MKTSKPRLSVEQVMALVQNKAPALTPHMFMDGEWIWYCGPSLAGESNKNVRQALKDIGFRFAFSGHVMRDNNGDPTSVVGTWGHSCAKPIPPRRRRPDPKPSEMSPAEIFATL